VNNKFVLVFYCPILRRAVNGSASKEIGYEIEMPKDWVKKYGPAIVFGLKILEASLVVGRLCGLPIPTVSGAANDAEDKLVEASNFVENMQKVLLEGVGNEGDESLAGILVSKFDAAKEEFVGELESSNNSLSDIQKKEIQKSFHGIGALIKDENSANVVSNKSLLKMVRLSLSILTLPPTFSNMVRIALIVLMRWRM